MKNILITLAALIFILTMLVYFLTPTPIKQVRFERPDFYIPASKEEAVSWNNWRSGITNLLISSKLPSPLPLGTKIFIYFQVDKEGNISDIKIHTDPSEYINKLGKHYREYIKSLQGNPKLKFPKNSKRNVVIIDSAIEVASKNAYTTPDEFQDYEKIKR